MSRERIERQREVTAMVALDNIDAIVGRVRNMLADERRITLARRYLHTDAPVEVTAGLTVYGNPEAWGQSNGMGFAVHLKPGLLTGFGFGAYSGEADTEADVWKRYHAYPDDRRDMTEVRITGGLANRGACRDDQLVIRKWNQHRVCTETVVVFDYDTGVQARLYAAQEVAFASALDET